jgi:methylated-DNA-[protein]-cysteine S-methyltransferase
MTAAPDFTFFETPVGLCGVLWSNGGVLGLQLPEANEVRARKCLLRRFQNAIEAVPPPAIADAINRIQVLLSGQPADLTGVRLDFARVSSFERQVYEVARTIPPGRTLTYGDVATRIGDKAYAQAIGRALGNNPFPIVVPCHRVVAADGKLGGFSAAGGAQTKLRLLQIEGAPVARQGDLFGLP